MMDELEKLSEVLIAPLSTKDMSLQNSTTKPEIVDDMLSLHLDDPAVPETGSDSTGSTTPPFPEKEVQL